jgi:hypothetical protein
MMRRTVLVRLIASCSAGMRLIVIGGTAHDVGDEAAAMVSE